VVGKRLGARWRAYEETRALDGRMLGLVARLVPRGPRPAVARSASCIVPKRRTPVSVVIPCYNYGRFLPDAVESALVQPGIDVEVIIVDDCSTDDSREVAERLVAAHPEVRLVVNPQNSGHVRSFNAGCAASSGEFVVKLDADDLLAPGALSRATALFEEHPSVGLVYGHPRHFSSAVPPIARMHEVQWMVWAGREWLEERCRLGVSAITNPEMVLRSSILRELGPMNPEVPYAPDMEISLRVATVSDVGYIRGADQALHREHSASMSETDGSGTLVDLRARATAFRAALRESRAQGNRSLEQTARRALAKDAVRFATAAADRDRPRGEIDDLLEFARTVCPACAAWRSVHRLERDRADGRLARIGRRIARKLRHEVYFARWLATGI
jgi:glycosyltransferase involved in cell wall biosynthesis